MKRIERSTYKIIFLLLLLFHQGIQGQNPIIRDIGMGALRWPGGAVVTFYHWDDLNGLGWTDSWNPAYDSADNQPPSAFMDLDEYLNLIDETGAEIMLGVNMSSGIEWDRVWQSKA